uniref:Cytochrome c biogenesis CcmF N-terminal-like protein n=1 Tax=Zygnema circumcarinatum TaxID=35869 RepID=A0A6N0GXI5_ZYGCR|nr:cytochrome c biogenesis CcmF N-terminal-like protein [Zygnema circumcarinatum]
MYTELSHYLFLLALCLSFNLKHHSLFWIVSIYLVLVTTGLFSAIASYICSDFSIANLFTNSNAITPLFFQIAATWSNHEGSLLLWCWLLSVYGFWFCYLVQPWKHSQTSLIIDYSEYRCAKHNYPLCFNQNTSCLSLLESFRYLHLRPDKETLQRLQALFIFVSILLFFAGFCLITSNPFLKIPFLCVNSVAELNPVLQDPILAIHPPCIYAGYVASAIGFSLCLSKCIPVYWNSNVHATSTLQWTEMWTQIRIWICVCWSFLTIGIFLGSWWAYHELGWGGWWFWDPVENASLMPWLLATACVHSVLLPKLNVWTLFLNQITFVLSILGTFFVRSGLLASVHSFATDSTRGLFVLCFLLGILAISTFYFVQYSKQSGTHTRAHGVRKFNQNVRYDWLSASMLLCFPVRTFADCASSSAVRNDLCLHDTIKGSRRRSLRIHSSVSQSRCFFSAAVSTQACTNNLHKSATLVFHNMKPRLMLPTARTNRNTTRLEQLLLMQNCVLFLICVVVLCGTGAPIVFQLLFKRDVSTGAPFFEGILVPLFTCTLLMLVYVHFVAYSVVCRATSAERFTTHKNIRAPIPTPQLAQRYKRLCLEKTSQSTDRFQALCFWLNQVQQHMKIQFNFNKVNTAVQRKELSSCDFSNTLQTQIPFSQTLNNVIPNTQLLRKRALYCVLVLLVFHLLIFKHLAGLSCLESAYGVFCFVMFCFIILVLFIETQRKSQARSRLVAFTTQSNTVAIHMQIAHAGLVLFLSGVLLSNRHKTQLTQIMRSGSAVRLGNHICAFRGIDHNYGPTFRSICGNIVVYLQAQHQIPTRFLSGSRFVSSNPPLFSNEYTFESTGLALTNRVNFPTLQTKLVKESLSVTNFSENSMDSECLDHYVHSYGQFKHILGMFPEKRFLLSNQQLSSTKVAIHTNLCSDIYALIGAGSFETGWFVTIMQLPFICCLWVGFLLAAMGGFKRLITLLNTGKLNWH